MTDQFTSFFNKNYRFNLNKSTHQFGVLDVRSNRYADGISIFTKYSQTMSDLGMTVGVTIDEVNAYITANMPKDEKEERMPPTQFIENWLKAHGAEWDISPAFKEINYTKGGASAPKDIEELRQAIMCTVYDQGCGYKAEEIKACLGKLAMDKMQNAIVDIMKNIAYDEKMVDAGERFLHAVYEYFDIEESYDIFATLMKHWAWQVKRKLKNLPTKDQIWPNFYGAGGLGKTTALKKLCKPFDDFCSVTNIAKLFDDTKEVKRLTENYVIIFDELAIDGDDVDAKLSKDQLAIMKSITTGEKLDARIYQSQNQAKRRITFSSISSANYHLYDIIFDEQTMRRWFEFHCKGKRPESFDKINKFLDNSYIFWRAIDDSRDEGYWDPTDGNVGTAITKIQETYYPTQSTTSMWIEAKHVRPGKESLNDAYDSYKQWCNESGNGRGKARQNFAKDIRHMLPEAVNEQGVIHLAWTDNLSDDPIYMKPNKTVSTDLSWLEDSNDEAAA